MDTRKQSTEQWDAKSTDTCPLCHDRNNATSIAQREKLRLCEIVGHVIVNFVGWHFYDSSN